MRRFLAKVAGFASALLIATAALGQGVQNPTTVTSASIIAGLGYTPLNQAGDTMSGALAVNMTPASTAQIKIGDAAFTNKNPDGSAIAMAGNPYPFLSAFTNNAPASGTNQGGLAIGVFNATPNSPSISFYMSKGTAAAPDGTGVGASGSMYLQSFNFMTTTQKWCQTTGIEGGQNGDALSTVGTSRGKIQLAVANGAVNAGCLDQSGPGLQVVYNSINHTNDIPAWFYHSGVQNTNNGFPATAVLGLLDWTTNSGEWTIGTLNRGGGGNTNMVLSPSSGLLRLVGGLAYSGSAPTGSGSCSITSQTGGNTAGKFAASGVCSSGSVILTFAQTAPTGWVCDIHDQTTPADVMNQTASTATTVTFTGSMANNDVMTFKCGAY